jgi:hypothetical protein
MNEREFEIMGQLELITENLLTDYPSVFPANHTAQDFYEARFTPPSITRKHKDRLAVVDDLVRAG